MSDREAQYQISNIGDIKSNIDALFCYLYTGHPLALGTAASGSRNSSADRRKDFPANGLAEGLVEQLDQLQEQI
jgi:hypothetical protein